MVHLPSTRMRALVRLIWVVGRVRGGLINKQVCSSADCKRKERNGMEWTDSGNAGGESHHS